MKYAVVNTETNIVENIIEVLSTSIDGLQAGLGMTIILCEEYNVQKLDTYNPTDGRFYRGEYIIPKSASIMDEINLAIDAYTLSLMEGGLL